MGCDVQRVVVTGLGAISPLGCGVDANWRALLGGQSGIGPIASFDARDFPVRIAGEVRDFDPAAYLEKKDVKKTDRFTQFAIAAAQSAVDDAGLTINADNAARIGVVVGVGMGGIATIEEAHAAFIEGGLRRVSPFFIPRLIANMAPGQIAIRFGCTGVNYTPTSACASGGQAVGEAFRLVRYGEQDAVITGGTEAAVTPMGVGGFAVMRAMSTRNDEPTRASRPFERNRDGFVIGEGAGILVLESLARASAQRRSTGSCRLRRQRRRLSHHLTGATAAAAADACAWRWPAAGSTRWRSTTSTPTAPRPPTTTPTRHRRSSACSASRPPVWRSARPSR
jgi:3-oxoacyl-[acyl-carrier-protein] synthase II